MAWWPDFGFINLKLELKPSPNHYIGLDWLWKAQGLASRLFGFKPSQAHHYGKYNAVRAKYI
jgi:hypothetical protein